MSIASDLTAVATNLNSALDEINDKIESKGGTASDTVYGVAAAVENLPSGGGEEIGNRKKKFISLSNGSYILPDSSQKHLCDIVDKDLNNIYMNLSSAQTNARMIVKFKINYAQANEWPFIIGTTYAYGTSQRYTMWVGIGEYGSNQAHLWAGIPHTISAGAQFHYIVNIGEWYYVSCYYDAVRKRSIIYLYDEDCQIISFKDFDQATVVSNTSRIVFLGGDSNIQTREDVDISLSETFLEMDNNLIWGKTSPKTENLGCYFPTFSEFTEVEYIESTGTQFIQTDTVIYSTDKVEAEVVFVDKSLATFAWCARESLDSKIFNALNLTGEFRFDYFDEQFTGPSVINNQKYKITMDGNKLYLDDALIKTFSQVNSNSVNPACLMASYNPYKTYANIGKMKHFGFRVWDNSSIIKANFVPCYHTATGIIGMFDTVNNKFYTNAGTGTFLKGADVNA